MALVITPVHHKGGCGKSSICRDFLALFKMQGKKAVLVDFDIQGSNTVLAQIKGRDIMNVLNISEFKTMDGLKKELENYDVALIDTPAYFQEYLPDILDITNIAIIPCKASLYDYLPIQQTMEFMIPQYERLKSKTFVACFVMTMVKQGSLGAEVIRKYIKENYPIIPILNTETIDRVAYADTMLIGEGHIFTSGNKQAIDEITELSEELLSLFIK